MAEDNPNDSQEESSKQGKPWLVLSLMLLIVPVVTLAITEFVVIPRLQSSMSSPGENRSAASSRSESAGDREAKSSYRFDEVVANLAGTMGTRFIKVSFEVRGRDPDLAHTIRTNQPIVKDAIITALSSESIQSLEIPGGRNRLRLSLIGAINQSLSMDLVEELYFTEFIIQ